MAAQPSTEGASDPLQAFPLAGKRVLVTRPQGQASRLVQALATERAAAIEIPVIQIEPPASWAPTDDALASSPYDWIVFTSANGVRFFLDRLDASGVGRGWLEHTRVAAIGPETARSLQARHVRTDLVPDEYVAEALVACLADATPLEGRRVLLPRADIARDALDRGLTAAGAVVDTIVVYRTVPAPVPPDLLDQLHRGAIDAVTFTSSSTVRALTGALGPAAALLRDLTIACIGPITAATAIEHDLRPTVVATSYTIDGLVAALRAFYAGQQPILAPEVRR